MISDKKPKKFDPIFEIVSCFVEYNDKILLLKRQPFKSEPNTYGVPAGKVEKDEDLINAIARETFEETGIKISIEKFKFYKTKYVKYETYDFIYHMFHTNLNELPKIIINEQEHQEYIWEYPKECLELDLIPDEDACIIDYYKL